MTAWISAAIVAALSVGLGAVVWWLCTDEDDRRRLEQMERERFYAERHDDCGDEWIECRFGGGDA